MSHKQAKLIAAALGLTLALAATASAGGSGAAPTRSFRDFQPAWSPDGKAIAFVRVERGRGEAIYLIRPDGSGLRRVTAPRSSVSSPSWAPDSNRLAFSDDGGGVYVLNVKNRSIRQINSTYVASSLDWGPGGRRIAFQDSSLDAFEAPHAQIVVMRPDGTEKREAASSDSESLYTGPTWSPDGKRLAFAAFEDYPEQASYLAVIDSIGGPVRQLLPQTVYDPDWSPDGKTILGYVLDGIVVIDLHSQQERKLPPGYSPGWSPDGRRIVFAREAGEDHRTERLYVMNADGTNVRQLTK